MLSQRVTITNRKMKSTRLTLIILLLLATHLANSQSIHPAIEKKIDSLFAEYNSETAGVAVAIVQEGKTIYSKGFGIANREYGIPITPKTVFHVASVSKQFTAFAIYLLEAQGKISFEDDIRKYIPEFWI